MTIEQKQKIKEKINIVNQVNSEFQTYLQGVADGLDLDPSKEWVFDSENLEFKEKE